MNHSPIRRLAAIAAVVPLTVLAACGDEGPVEDPATSDAPAETLPPPEFDGPTSTVSPDLPEAMEDAVGPLDITGDPLTPFLNDTDNDPAVGTEAPVLLGLDFDGRPVRVDAVEDGPTMAVFLAHWCSHCNEEVPLIRDMQADGRIPEELNVIGIATGSNPEFPNYPPGEWLDDRDWPYPVLADGYDPSVPVWLGLQAFGGAGFPYTVLIDEDGTVAARWSGSVSAEEMRSNIRVYLGLS